MTDRNRIHRVFQCALLVAGQGDDYQERALSPIHLIKYLYLADMDYAKYNDGHTYTGLDWRFHHFGPWSATAFQQIENALSTMGALKSTFPSNFGDKDYTRWSVDFDQTKFDELKRELPIEIRSSVQHYVGRYRNNTTALLHFVYATTPMLNAAPGEILDFSVLVTAESEKREEFTTYVDRLSNKKRKLLIVGMDKLRERFRKKVAPHGKYLRTVSGQADAVFEEGVAWLDGLAGKPFPEEGTTVHFADEVWKSKARSGDV